MVNITGETMPTLTDREFADAMSLVENIPDDAVADELEDLVQRELGILDVTPDAGPELREITIHNAVVLTAAAARLRRA